MTPWDSPPPIASLLPTLPRPASRSLFTAALDPSAIPVYRITSTSSLIIRDRPALHLFFGVHARYRKYDDDTDNGVTRTHLNWKCPRPRRRK